ncbi:MAG: acylphosphatase [Desulfobacterales bacterium]|nr:acylphosphatase [Desulfobacterales bacterium]
MKHVNIRVSGIVQGVSFRYYTQKKADALKIKGFVMNKPDGSVYIEAEAEEDILEQFIEWCQHGPSAARVDHIEISPDTLKNFSSFDIRYSSQGLWD